MDGVKKETGIDPSDPQVRAKRPKLAFALMLIGGILISVVGLLVVAAGYLLPSLVNFLVNNTNITANVSYNISKNLSSTIAQLANSQLLNMTSSDLMTLQNGIYTSGLIGTISGIIIVLMAVMVRKAKEAKNIRVFSAVALIFSIVSYFGGGGVLVGMILAFIGGILGIFYKG